MSSPRFIGVSTGRAGSVYIATVMERAGIPTTHEQHYIGPKFIDGRPQPWRRGELGEWSAQAVPHLDTIGAGLVLHQVRHPLKVIGSYLGFGLFHRPRLFGEQGRAITDHFPLQGEPLLDAVRFYVDWNRRCEKHSDMRWRVEDVDDALLVRIGDLLGTQVNPAAARSVPETANTHSNAVSVTWSDLPDDPAVDELRLMAHDYGYEVSDGGH